MTGGGNAEVEGFVLRSEVLLAVVKGQTGTIGQFMRPVHVIPSSVRVDQVFEIMLAETHHLMMVEDEFGTSVGLITLEDVLETIVGVEIIDEHDQIADLRVLARRLWRKRATRMGLPVGSGADSKKTTD